MARTSSGANQENKAPSSSGANQENKAPSSSGANQESMAPSSSGADQENKEVAAAIEELASPLVLTWLRADDVTNEKVSPAQLRAMVVLDRTASCNLTQLAQELDTIPSWASRLCDRLTAAGYVERQAGGQDRREVVLRLRGEGRQLLADLRRRRRDLLGDVVDQMTASERAALLVGLEGFARVAGKGFAGETHMS